MNPEVESIDKIPSRRKFIFEAMAVAISSISIKALASSEEHEHHHDSIKYADLVDSAVDCMKKGQLCRDHCIELVKSGDTSISDCLDIVVDTISMCETLTQLAVSNSRHLKSFANVCIEVCKDCEKECRVHEDKHKQCKDCMESCENCIEQLEKIIA